MNWRDDLLEDLGYIICPICFPEYVHCNEKCEKCEECEEYIELKKGLSDKLM